MDAPIEQRSSVSATESAQGNAGPRRALAPEAVAKILDQLADELRPPIRFARLQTIEGQGDHPVWVVYEGDEGDLITARRLAIFALEEHARQFVFAPPTVRVVTTTDLDRVEGDARGVLLFLKLDHGVDGLGPVVVLAPAVVEAAHAQLTRRTR